jgi:hypothetical protein
MKAATTAAATATWPGEPAVGIHARREIHLETATCTNLHPGARAVVIDATPSVLVARTVPTALLAAL